MTITTLLDPLAALPEHEAWLRTTLLSRLGNLEEVEEVMQEVALAAAAQASRAEKVESVAPWLYRVALRQMLLFRRRAGRQRKLVQNVATTCRPSEVAAGRTPLEYLLHQERRQEVRQALLTVGERERQLLMLKYVEGLSYCEIAQRLGVSAPAVQSRLHRARRLLRNRLKIIQD